MRITKLFFVFFTFIALLMANYKACAASASRSLFSRAITSARNHPVLTTVGTLGAGLVGAYALYKWWTKRRPRVNLALNFSMDAPSERELAIMNGDMPSERRNEIAQVLYKNTDLPPEIVNLINGYEYEFLGMKQFEQKNLIQNASMCQLTLRSISGEGAVPFWDKNRKLKLAVVGNMMDLSSEYNILTIIDVQSRRIERIFSLENVHLSNADLNSAVRLEVFSNGKIATSCSSEKGIVKVWNSETGQLLTSVKLTDYVQDCHVRELMAISCEKVAILVLGNDRKEHIVVWNICSNMVEKILPARQSTVVWDVRNMALLSNERLVRACHGDIIEILDLKTGQSRKLGTSSYPDNMVSQPVILPGGQKIAVLREHVFVPAGAQTIVDPNIFIDIWDIDSGSRIGKYCIKLTAKGYSQKMVALPNGHLIVGFADGNLEEWDIENNKCLRMFKDDNNNEKDPIFSNDPEICSLEVSPDGTVVSSTRSKIIVWR